MKPRFLLVAIGVVIAIPASAPESSYSQNFRCGNSANVPLPDLTRPYQGQDFGLYPGRRTTPPDDYLAPGLERARQIRPLDEDGIPSPNGKIILLSLGMSNTSSEFGSFITDANRNPAINRNLTILNGSLSGADAAVWTDLNSVAWRNAIAAANRGMNSARQVQVIWVKQARLRTVAFPAELDELRSDLESMLQIAKSVFPNLQIVYLSSRTRAGVAAPRGPTEPRSYESAFAVRKVIANRMAMQAENARNNPWIGWGPYLWSNGTQRSDGFVWDCGDLAADMLHPSNSGNQKVATQLMAFFMTAETAAPWFLDPSLAGKEPAIQRIAPSTTSGNAPLTVQFNADVTGAAEYFWTYEDGTFSTAQDPQKTFHLDGTYKVQLTVTDAAGRWDNSSVEIQVGDSR
jgi:hypothetical protein